MFSQSATSRAILFLVQYREFRCSKNNFLKKKQKNVLVALH